MTSDLRDKDGVRTADSEAAARQSDDSYAGLRHWGGFLLGGGTAFAVDAGVLMLLTRVLGIPALAARLVAIATAMVVSWLINRTVTFPTGAPPSIGELLRFAAVAWTAAAVNYLVFAGLILLWPAMHPVIAVGIASLVAMCFSYAGMRFGVFRRPSA